MKVVKFETQNCAICQQVSRFLALLGVEHERIIPFDRPDLAIGYRIISVPTVIVVDGDSVLNRTVGFKPHELETIALLITVDNRRKTGYEGLLSAGETYFTSSELGGIFSLKYLGMEDSKHVFESTAFLNRGYQYRVNEADLALFLYKG